MRVGVLDHGSGNLHSACRALEAVGATVTVTGDRELLEACDALVVPGVGAFAACMAGLRAIDGETLIRDWIVSGRPLLGICVGHQILFEGGTEHGRVTPGLGVWSGQVARLPAQRLPHMGWNTVRPPEHSRLFAGVTDERFYFVHSYAALGPPEGTQTTLSDHEVPFVAAVERDNVFSTQFHPEKSGSAGTRLLGNWLSQA
ncbi:imidazole glycerol phosphate synthase subunit HisH [Arachnia propionica]|uniref:imidazole glycerol phosphate synthase subunit HisH n=1 Tax=Arachnia propionica TaxID=1750 RepID=UPI001C8A7F4E|nr:imidazole glycerol phosphate synthase subunit HisH [Arachnia propionica]MDO5081920.1 imidazole glycerol phosphate synthase subunit HisH [Arachnia propionica]